MLLSVYSHVSENTLTEHTQNSIWTYIGAPRLPSWHIKSTVICVEWLILENDPKEELRKRNRKLARWGPQQRVLQNGHGLVSGLDLCFTKTGSLLPGGRSSSGLCTRESTSPPLKLSNAETLWNSSSGCDDPNHMIISWLLHTYNFATALNCNINIWSEGHLIYDPCGCDLSWTPSKVSSLHSVTFWFTQYFAYSR